MKLRRIYKLIVLLLLIVGSATLIIGRIRINKDKNGSNEDITAPYNKKSDVTWNGKSQYEIENTLQNNTEKKFYEIPINATNKVVKIALKEPHVPIDIIMDNNNKTLALIMPPINSDEADFIRQQQRYNLGSPELTMYDPSTKNTFLYVYLSLGVGYEIDSDRDLENAIVHHIIIFTPTTKDAFINMVENKYSLVRENSGY